MQNDVMRRDASRTNDGPATARREGMSRASDPARSVLRRALRIGVRGCTRDGELRDALHRACAVTRDSGLHVEDLLVLLKEVWRELPEARRAPRQEADELLARVISLCINEYYAPAGNR